MEIPVRSGCVTTNETAFFNHRIQNWCYKFYLIKQKKKKTFTIIKTVVMFSKGCKKN